MVERRLHLELKDHHGYRAIQAIYGVGHIQQQMVVAEIETSPGSPLPAIWRRGRG